MGDILVGTASWTDKSLIEAGWYPKKSMTAEERLRYYAERFPVVEVDSSYYFLPSEKNSRLWAERTPAGFTFNVKAFSLLTQHPAKPQALKDFDVPEKKSVYPADLGPRTMDAVWDAFLSAIAPLADAGKLGALLFQFPPWFTIGKRNREYILDCARRAAPFQICVELRNKTWMSPENQDETLSFLEGHGLPYVCVDMPQGFVSSIPPVVAATSTDLAVIRFHGHNDAEWESGSVQRRFAYDYPEDELRSWVPKIRDLAEESKTTHVLMNNCYRDYAQRNAKELSALLHGRT